jgi:hypothetical protein
VVARDNHPIMPSFILFSIISPDNRKCNFVFVVSTSFLFT